MKAFLKNVPICIIVTSLICFSSCQSDKNTDSIRAENINTENKTVEINNTEIETEESSAEIETEESSAEIKTWIETWDDEIINSDHSEVSYDYSFESVSELYYLITRNPEKYNGKKIKIIGTIKKVYEGIEKTYLSDITLNSQNLKGVNSASSDLNKIIILNNLFKGAECINIYISSDAQHAVARDGFFVKLYGTLTISRYDISISNCKYELIATFDERLSRQE